MTWYRRVVELASTHRNLIVMAIPPVCLAVFIWLNGVTMPFWDQWELVPAIQHILHGHFSFNDVWVQHNEHRLLLPKLLMLLCATITHWNTRFEMFVSLAIAISGFMLMMAIARITRQARDPAG